MDLVSGRLTTGEQAKLNDAKIRTRIEDERYLRAHPEIKLMTTAFLKDVLKQQPENIKAFARDWFLHNLEDKIAKEKSVQETQHILTA